MTGVDTYHNSTQNKCVCHILKKRYGSTTCEKWEKVYSKGFNGQPRNQSTVAPESRLYIQQLSAKLSRDFTTKFPSDEANKVK